MNPFRKLILPKIVQSEQSSGLVATYPEEENALDDALTQRRQKLAQTKIHIGPEHEAPDPEDLMYERTWKGR